MPHALPIDVDVHEPQSGIAEYLRELGAEAEFVTLAAGDYAIGARILVERKSVLDFHSSIVRRRLWRQIGAMRQEGAVPYLLIEGHSLDDGPLGKNVVRGACLAALGAGVRLIQTTDQQDSALWLHRLAVRAARHHRHW